MGIARAWAVNALSITHIGKATNRLDDVPAGLVADPDEVVARYDDTLYERFRLHALPELQSFASVKPFGAHRAKSQCSRVCYQRKVKTTRPQLHRYVDVASQM